MGVVMPSQPFNVGAVQMESQDDLVKNLEVAASLVAEAASLGARVILLPENFAFMGGEEEKYAIAERLDGDRANGDGPILSRLRALATKHAVTLIAGGLPERSEDPRRPFNTSCAVSPKGEVLATYRKIHLFDVEVGDGATYRESASTSAGASAVVVDAPIGDALHDGDVQAAPIGLTVCYDLRFPALYQRLADKGAIVATVPAAFTLMTGKDHWQVLLRARAIESQVYVLAAAQCGLHPRGRRTFGKSCLVDPWGEIIAQASEGTGVVVGRVDPTRVSDVRRRLPSLQHRRPFE